MKHLKTMNSKQLYSNTFKWAVLICLLCLIIFNPVFAQSNNPLDNIQIIPGGAGNKDLGAIIKFFVKLIGTALPFVILIFVFSDALIALFSGLRDARKDGEWGKFFFGALMIIIAIAFAVWIGSIIFNILGKFDDFFKFT